MLCIALLCCLGYITLIGALRLSKNLSVNHPIRTVPGIAGSLNNANPSKPAAVDMCFTCTR
jgi:hypothetical protein